MDENENKIPKVITNRFDLKAQTIFTFHNMYHSIASGEIEGGSTTAKVSLVTPQGIITGDIVTDSIYSDCEPNTENLPLYLEKLAFKSRNDLLAELENANQASLTVINNSGVIIVRDATLIPWNSPKDRFNFASLYVFASDITGFTIGDPIS